MYARGRAGRRLKRSAVSACTIVLGAGLLAACTGLVAITTSFTPTTAYTRSARAPGDILLVHLGNEPNQPFQRVGQLQATRTEWQNNEDLVNAVRREASRSGLDGVVEFRCGLSAMYAYECNGTGFVFVR
ncbi:hypothetical protein [Vineibacter terrae]|uniref:hypothetical protein n=1 Tax=Vineibacter terrae TaxID=2586908 RepID=UPI002E375673|nr:hypothetical protein [Vineibacter terrae]HEX2888354.1 hypothetical protein [Vineibacter terrae]